MRLLKTLALLAAPVHLIASALPVSVSAGEPIRHALTVVLQPEKNHLQVSDAVTLPENGRAGGKSTLHFMLREGLRPASPTPGVALRPEPDAKTSGSALDNRSSPMERFAILLPPGLGKFVIEYEGRFPPPSGSEDPGLEAGVISKEGIFLSGAALWYPLFGEERVTFTLEVRMPRPWEAVSQGLRTRHEVKDGWTESRWESPQPQEEIFLVGGPFTEYRRSAGKADLMVFLRTADRELAERYLAAGADYLQMYQELLGPYPYGKFAVVENFWETGFGMPSFTLLGSSVIRLPFIIESSYPHEILHNWWGTGVYVDYEKGNWSEGLTAYLADHLIREQKGSASEYRAAALQKYLDYAAANKDFPLTSFRSRNSAATEAVGYGKTMMFFHMLRNRMGDGAFINGLKKFYRENLFRRAGFGDLRAAMAAAAGEDLKLEFRQWTEGTGAPALRVGGARAKIQGSEYRLTARLEQTQAGGAYRLRVPVAVTIEGRVEAYQTAVAVDSKHFEMSLEVPGRPLRLDIDPEFDLFRRLDPYERPPALSGAFGAEKTLYVVPAGAPDSVRRMYRAFAEGRRRPQTGSIDIRGDDELTSLPSDRAVWVLGWENRFLSDVRAALGGYEVRISPEELGIRKTHVPRENHAVVLTARRSDPSGAPITWLAVDRAASLPGLARKLPHYGPYSYLVFEGDGPTNIEKGLWEVQTSPLSVLVSPFADGKDPVSRAEFQPRRPLAERPAIRDP